VERRQGGKWRRREEKRREERREGRGEERRGEDRRQKEDGEKEGGRRGIEEEEREMTYRKGIIVSE